MNEIVNQFLFVGDKVISEMHLRQPAFTYSACGPFTKNRKRKQKFKQTEDSSISQNKLDKACFQHDKVLRNKVFNIAKYPKYDGYQRGLNLMVYRYFDEKTSNANTSGGAIKNEILTNRQLTEELHKPIIRKFKKHKVYSCFKDSIWGADISDMQLIRKFNKGFQYLFFVVNFLGKYACVASLKNKKIITITKAFQIVLNKPKRKPIKNWVDKGSEFYNISIKLLFQDNDIELCSTHNEGKFVVAERFVRSLKDNIYKHMTSI